MNLDQSFTNIANAVARAAGTPAAFIVCCLTILVWGISGPVFGFSDTWQLIINTGTTIIIAHGLPDSEHPKPGRRGASRQADELVRVSEGRNAYIGIEHLTETRRRGIQGGLRK